MSEANFVSIDWRGYGDKIKNPSEPDISGFTIEGAKSYFQSWANAYFQPAISGSITAESLAREALNKPSSRSGQIIL